LGRITGELILLLPICSPKNLFGKSHRIRNTASVI
jgi:hypothetical protein